MFMKNRTTQKIEKGGFFMENEVIERIVKDIILFLVGVLIPLVITETQTVQAQQQAQQQTQQKVKKTEIKEKKEKPIKQQTAAVLEVSDVLVTARDSQKKEETEMKVSTENAVATSVIEIEEKDVNDKESMIVTIKREVKVHDANSSKVITTLSPETDVVIEEEAINGWLKLKGSNRYIYYLNTDYTKRFVEETFIQQSFDEITFGRTTTNVNLRPSPDITTEPIRCLDEGTKLELISLEHVIQGEEFGWYKVKLLDNEVVGYVYGEYVTIGNGNVVPSERVVVKQVAEEQATAEQASTEQATAEQVAAEQVATEQASTEQAATEQVAAGNETTEQEVILLAKVMVQEAGGCGIQEMGFCGQVLVNRRNLNGTDIKTELTRKGQYPTTWKLINSGKVRETTESIELARQLLCGEKNGFEGSPIPEIYWDKIYFQSKGSNGKEIWKSPISGHRFGVRFCDFIG